MQQFGPSGLRITKASTYKRCNYWTNHANCLYYYKKDLLESMYHIPVNPINAKSKSTVDFSNYAYLFRKPGVRTTSKDMINNMSQRERFKVLFRRRYIFYVNKIFI